MPVIRFKVDPDTDRKICSKERVEKPSVSAYLRKVAPRADTSTPVRVGSRLDPVSGLPFNVASYSRVTTEEKIKAALSGFP